MTADRPEATIVYAVRHGGVLTSLFNHTLGLPPAAVRRFSLFNAAINRFSIESGTWRLDTWGGIAHLRGLETIDDN